MIVYRSEDFLRGDDEMCHFPDGHFEVHLRKLVKPTIRFSRL